MSNSKPTILIAGAGIGGLTAALALIEAGFGVEIHEQAAELRELGAGVQLGPNGARVLIALGLRDALAAHVCEASGKEVRLWNTGQTWKLFDLGRDSIERFGAPYWMAHRGDLHRIMWQEVERRVPGAIRLNARAVGVEQDGAGVTLFLANGQRATGAALVGADGVHSTIRAALFGDSQPEFTGVMAWRGLIPMDQLPAALRRPVGTNWVGPGGHVITYPVRSDLLNFVGVVETDEWVVESWNEPGTTGECAADFPRWHADVRLMIERIATPYKWALLSRAPMERWADGRVCLLGDACHPTLPFLAQGANMAIEDGAILARCLDADAGDIPAAFRRFQRARLGRTSRVVRGSSDNTKRFHNPALADPDEGAAYIEREWAADKVRTRYDWLFEYDAMSVAI